MSGEVEVALISAVVVIIGIVVNAFLTRSQIQRERSQWLTSLKRQYSVALHRRRLKAYPEVFRIIGQLSHMYPDTEIVGKAEQVARELNEWLYSAGGMCAESGTRGAILQLRHACLAWSNNPGKKPDELYRWRNTALYLLRRDLYLEGLEDYDPKSYRSLLDQLEGKPKKADPRHDRRLEVER